MTGAQADLGTRPDVDRTDLSSAFGGSAADALRGLLAPRRAPVQAVDAPDDGAETGTTGEPSEPRVPRRTGAAATPEPHRARPARPAPGHTTSSRITASRGTRDGAEPTRGTPGSPRPSRPAPSRTPPSHETGGSEVSAQRRRPVRVRDRDDVDLLLLAVARDGVANGRDFIARVRERSGGAVELTERRVYHELHRLRTNRLIADTGRGGRARFVLTDSGERILLARTHRWQAYARAMNQILGE